MTLIEEAKVRLRAMIKQLPSKDLEAFKKNHGKIENLDNVMVFHALTQFRRIISKNKS